MILGKLPTHDKLCGRFSLPSAVVLPAALAAPVVAVSGPPLTRSIACTAAAAQQRRAHLLLHFPHPVCQGPHFRHVHNWRKELEESGGCCMSQRHTSNEVNVTKCKKADGSARERK
jgi:hypothetical protein